MTNILYSIRDTLWEYPQNFISLFTRSRPVGTLLFLGILMIVLLNSLLSPNLYAFLSEDNDQAVFTEGILGSITTYNPMFVTGSDTDRALFELVYTPLIRLNDDGLPEPALATSWELSKNGRDLIFNLSDQYYWHDGTKVSADDVKYTIERAVLMGSRGFDTFGTGLSGVVVKKINENSVQLTLDENIASIYESLAIYIVPSHIFSEMDDRDMFEYGRIIPPVGSGFYRVVRITENSILLAAWNRHPDAPQIGAVQLLYFNSLDGLRTAFQNNLLDAISNVDANNLEILNQYPSFHTYQVHIDQRKKILYFNLKNDRLSDRNLRYGISQAINRQALVEEIPTAFKETYFPLSSESWAYLGESGEYTYPFPYNPKEARSYLESAGFKYDEELKYFKDGNDEIVSFRLTYLDNQENTQLADQVKDQLEEIGLLIELQPVPYQNLINEVLATRSFELLLLQIEVTADPDQYNLWHSTKVNYPDLNISGYEYNRIDILLERSRTNESKKERLEDYLQIQRLLSLDMPAIVLYEPAYTYIVRDGVENIDLSEANFPYERFHNISEWRFKEN